MSLFVNIHEISIWTCWVARVPHWYSKRVLNWGSVLVDMSSVCLVVWISLGPPLPTRPLSQCTSLLHFHTKSLSESRQSKHQHKAAITAWAHNRLGISSGAYVEDASSIAHFHAILRWSTSQIHKLQRVPCLKDSISRVKSWIITLCWSKCFHLATASKTSLETTRMFSCLWKDSVIPVELLDCNLRRE